MARRWGSADFDELQDLYDRLKRLENADLDRFCKSASKELAARLLALVIPRTPVGDYEVVKEQITAQRNSKHHQKGETYTRRTGSNKNGGTLRRGWTGGVEQNGAVFARSLPITKSGDTYTIIVTNTVAYAAYVEFGHRQTPGRYVPVLGKRLKQNFVEGQYMLTNSEKDLELIATRVLQQKLERFLRGVFTGNG